MTIVIMLASAWDFMLIQQSGILNLYLEASILKSLLSSDQWHLLTPKDRDSSWYVISASLKCSAFQGDDDCAPHLLSDSS